MSSVLNQYTGIRLGLEQDSLYSRIPNPDEFTVKFPCPLASCLYASTRVAGTSPTQIQSTGRGPGTIVAH